MRLHKSVTSPTEIAGVAQAAERRHAADPEALLLGNYTVDITGDPDMQMHICQQQIQ